jgi:hypothetical protein
MTGTSALEPERQVITGRAGGQALRTDSGNKTCDQQNHIQIVNVSSMSTFR